MRKLEIRPAVLIAYEDHWFGEPWIVPETVVMVHGNSESSRAWTCWVLHLARKYRVVRPDLPGFGESPEPPGYGWSATELAANIGRLLDALQIETCHLIGAKYGGSAKGLFRDRRNVAKSRSARSAVARTRSERKGCSKCALTCLDAVLAWTNLRAVFCT